MKFTPKIVAHRGASQAEKENTIAAFERAVAMGADMVELDVRRTRDAHMVVHHDPRIQGFGVINECLLADLPDYVPTLGEALDSCQGIDVNVEIKSDRAEPDYDPTHSLTHEVVAFLMSRTDVDRMLVSSFDADVLRLVRAQAPRIATGFLYTVSPTPGRIIARCVAEGHSAIHPYAKSLTKGVVNKAHAAGLRVNTWTVDDAERIRELARWGVDAIITNTPDRARQALQ